MIYMLNIKKTGKSDEALRAYKQGLKELRESINTSKLQQQLSAAGIEPAIINKCSKKL